jgi:arylsulfatase A-like enzyme
MHGYDEYFCTESKVPTYDPMLYPAAFGQGESKRYGWKAAEEDSATRVYGTYYWTGPGQMEEQNLRGDDSRVIMDRAIPFIKRAVRKEKFFFATLWFHTPHLPVVADSVHRELYRNMGLQEQIYFGTISAMDKQMGRLRDTLESLGQWDNTMIWFCSDNGPEINTPGSAGTFRERKRSLYEGGVRVPAFVVWESGFEGGARIHAPMVTSDYLPTILHVLDLTYPENRPLDGENVMKILTGESDRRGRPIGFAFQDKVSWVGDTFKLLSTDRGNSYELYDLLKDPAESDDRWDTETVLRQRLQTELENWLVSVKGSAKGNDYGTSQKD